MHISDPFLLPVPPCYHEVSCCGGIADAEIDVPSKENPELTNVFPLKLRVGQNIAMYTSPSSSFFSRSSPYFLTDI